MYPPAEPVSVDRSLDLTNGYDSLTRFLEKSLLGNPTTLELTPLTGGTTNTLLKGVDKKRQVSFLIRTYGSGTESIINRDREYATHLHLLENKLAPALYARFQNALIYGYIPGKPLHYTEMSRDWLIPAIANRLAQWHTVLNPKRIEDSIRDMNPPNTKFSLNLWQTLEEWIKVLPDGILGVSKDDLRAEVAWFEKKCGDKGGPTVVSHCDLLSGNIIVPESLDLSETEGGDLGYPSSNFNVKEYVPSELATFIDYEYTVPAPRAFDLANHFSEWQGFDCRTDLIPEPSKKNPKLRYWCFHYLAASHHFAHTDMADVEAEIDDLIVQIQSWWGMPGFYWSIWGCIQSQISDIDFDYKSYCQNRISEYFEWKKNYPHNYD